MRNYANILIRVIASLIDLSFMILILLLNTIIINLLIVDYPYNIISYFLIFFLAFTFNHSFLQGIYGFTIGKSFVGIKVINSKGRYIGISKSFLRDLIKFNTLLCSFLSLYSINKNKKYQAWHDKIVSSYVIKEKKENNDIFCFSLMKPIPEYDIRYFKEYDFENNAFLEEIQSLKESSRYYKVYIDPEGLVTKYGYFVEGELINYSKFKYEEYSTSVNEYDMDRNFIRGIRYLFDTKGKLVKSVPISKEDYNKMTA